MVLLKEAVEEFGRVYGILMTLILLCSILIRKAFPFTSLLLLVSLLTGIMIYNVLLGQDEGLPYLIMFLIAVGTVGLMIFFDKRSISGISYSLIWFIGGFLLPLSYFIIAVLFGLLKAEDILRAIWAWFIFDAIFSLMLGILLSAQELPKISILLGTIALLISSVTPLFPIFFGAFPECGTILTFENFYDNTYCGCTYVVFFIIIILLAIIGLVFGIGHGIIMLYKNRVSP